METWVLIFWLMIDRGGGPATAEFSSRERCEAAAKAIFDAPRYPNNPLRQWGNFVCVPK